MIYTSYFTYYASTAWVPMISESNTYAVLNYAQNIKFDFLYMLNLQDSLLC